MQERAFREEARFSGFSPSWLNPSKVNVGNRAWQVKLRGNNVATLGCISVYVTFTPSLYTRRMRILLTIILAFICGPAFAGDLTVSVRDNAGRPVRDAVVTVRPDAGVPAGPIRFSWPLRIVQQDIQFQPYVLIAPVGQAVAFPNLDRVRHHIYSFSRGNRFEIELFGRDATRTHAFATAGVAALGCNIHDQMLAYVRVVDTPYAGKTDATGDFSARAAVR